MTIFCRWILGSRYIYHLASHFSMVELSNDITIGLSAWNIRSIICFLYITQRGSVCLHFIQRYLDSSCIV